MGNLGRLLRRSIARTRLVCQCAPDIGLVTPFRGASLPDALVAGAAAVRLAHLALILPLAACLQLANDLRLGPDGAPQVVLRSGMNCHARDCIDLDLRFRTVRADRRQPVAVPPGIDIGRGVVSVVEFSALAALARAAPDEEIDVPDPNEG